MSQHMRLCARRISAASVIFLSSFPVSAGGLLDQWSWAEVREAKPPERRVEVSIGSYFGDNSSAVAPDLRLQYGGADTFWSGVAHQTASDLLDRPGGGFAYVSLPTDGIRNIKSLQVGVFDIKGLGAGFDTSGSTTITIAHEKVIPAVVGECGRVITPATTIVQTETQSFAETTDDEETLSGVEFNVVLDDKVTFGGISGFETFAGARFINYGDSYASSFSNSSTSGGGSSDIRTLAVANHLVGAHVGVSGKKFLSADLLLTGRLAAGLFANFATRGGAGASFASSGTSYSYERNTRDTGFAQMLEFSPALHYRIRDDMFVSLGGTFMLLNGVSEANGSTAAGFATSGGDSGAYFFYGGRATFHWNFN